MTLAIKFANSLLIVVIRGKFWYYDRIERQKSVSDCVKWEYQFKVENMKTRRVIIWTILVVAILLGPTAQAQQSNSIVDGFTITNEYTSSASPVQVEWYRGTEETEVNIIIWQYEDDFNLIDKKAEKDSYSHTTFCPIVSYCAPALCYWPEFEILEIRPSNFEPAFLAYRFPLDNILTGVVSGTCELDVLPLVGGYCPLYQLSDNGVDWTSASSLVGGHNTIPLSPSDNPFIYLRLFGYDYAYIDNLSVIVAGPEIQGLKTLEADLNNDGIVNMMDLALFSNYWLRQDIPFSNVWSHHESGLWVDINMDEIINMLDFSIIAIQWMQKELWYEL